MQWRARPYQNMYQRPAGYFYPQRDTAITATESAKRYSHYSRRIRKEIQPLRPPPYQQQGQYSRQEFYPNQEYGHMRLTVCSPLLLRRPCPGGDRGL
nr:hypothetical protein [Bacillus velezensis]